MKSIKKNVASDIIRKNDSMDIIKNKIASRHVGIVHIYMHRNIVLELNKIKIHLLDEVSINV